MVRVLGLAWLGAFAGWCPLLFGVFSLSLLIEQLNSCSSVFMGQSNEWNNEHNISHKWQAIDKHGLTEDKITSTWLWTNIGNTLVYGGRSMLIGDNEKWIVFNTHTHTHTHTIALPSKTPTGRMCKSSLCVWLCKVDSMECCSIVGCCYDGGNIHRKTSILWHCRQSWSNLCGFSYYYSMMKVMKLLLFK